MVEGYYVGVFTVLSSPRALSSLGWCTEMDYRPPKWSSTQELRYYRPQADADMTLTVEALGLYKVPVLSSASLEALDRG